MFSISDRIEAFIFDMDGIITDTVQFHYLSWKRLFDAEGIPFTPEDNRDLLGRARDDSLRLILSRYGRQVTAERFQLLYELKNRYFLELTQMMSEKDLLPGIRDLIMAVKTAGLKTAVASSSRNTRHILDKLGIFQLFDLVTDSNTIARAKPAPDLFLHAASRLMVDPGRTVVIEDAEAGIAAARSAGMLVIGIGAGEHLTTADLYFASAAEIEFNRLLRDLEGIPTAKRSGLR